MEEKKRIPPLEFVANRPLLIDEEIKNADYIVPDWLTPPEAVSEDAIVRCLDTDVLVAGAGLSGLCTALRAAQNGLKVIVCEKTATYVGRGGMFGSTDSRLMRELGISLDKDRIAREWIHLCGNRCREDLVRLFVDKSGDAMDWLIDFLAEEKIYPGMYGGQYKGPEYTEYAGTHMFVPGEGCRFRQWGTALVCAALKTRAEEAGVTFLFHTPVNYLEKAEGRVVGAIAEAEDGRIRIRASRGVVLACGDITENQKMMAYYAPFALKPARTAAFPPNANTGDGHKMGLWAGGSLEDGPWSTMVHLVGEGLYTFAFLFVNRLGQRFMNEDSWVQAKSVQCLNQPLGEYAFTVFDSRWIADVERTVDLGGGQFWDSFSRRYGEPWTPEDAQIDHTLNTYLEKGIAFAGSTIAELAEKMGVPAEALEATVARYNELYRKGHDDDYGKRPELLTEIAEPPFYAIRWAPALLAVTGGLNTNTRMQVLDKTGRSIPGLYAVGNNAGGLYGSDYPVILNGNSHARCVLWGMQAADSLSEKLG